MSEIRVLMFLSIDVRKRQFDNLLIKVALFFVGILLLTLLSGILELDVNYFIVPLVIAAIASFYHYWRSLSNLRLKIGSLAFIIVLLGFIVATVKHQGLLISGPSNGLEFDYVSLSEFFLDIVILMLGGLLTYLELSRKSDEPKETPNKNNKNHDRSDSEYLDNSQKEYTNRLGVSGSLQSSNKTNKTRLVIFPLVGFILIILIRNYWKQNIS